MNFSSFMTATALVCSLLLAGGQARAESDSARLAELAVAGPMGDMAIGNPQASVTVYEYGSFTCPHCADFANDTFPEFQANYIDTGKVFYVFRAFGFNKDPLGMTAAMLAQCAGPARHIDFIKLFFKTRRQWAPNSTEEGLQKLRQLVKEQGVTDREFDTCTNSPQVFDHVRQVEQRGHHVLRVTRTPTFFINGEKYTGSMSYDSLAEKLEERLAP